MEITLNNFRCYRHAVISIPDSGVIRIKGYGGAGKSTILNAIYFALYGKYRKPYTYGNTKCSVKLYYQRYDLHITRSKLPANKLIVKHKGIEYEDDNAQGIIERVLGVNHTNFYLSSYFDQRKQGSVLSMSPSEQLSFIETIAFEDDAHEVTKEQTKAHTKTLEKMRDDIISRISLIESQIDTCNKKIASLKSVKLENELGNEDEHDALKKDANETSQKLKELQVTLKEKRKEVLAIHKRDTENRKSEDDRLRLETQVSTLNKNIEALGDIKPEADINIADGNLKELKQLLENIRDYNKTLRLQEELNDGIETYRSNIQNEIKKLQSTLIKPDDLKSYKASLKTYEARKSIFDAEELALKNYKESIANAKKELVSIRDTLVSDYDCITKTQNKSISGNVEWSALNKVINSIIKHYTVVVDNAKATLVNLKYESWSCPTCSTPLHPKKEEGSSSLHVRPVRKKSKSLSSKDDVPTLKLELSSAHANLELLKSYLDKGALLQVELSKPEPTQTPNDTGIASIKDYQKLVCIVSEQANIEKQIASLQSELKTLPLHLQKLKSQIKDINQFLPKNIAKNEFIGNEGKLVEKVKTLEKEIDDAWRTRGDYSKYSRELRTLEKNLKTISGKYLKAPDSRESTLESAQKEVKNIEKEIDKLNDILLEVNSKLALSEDRLAIKFASIELEKLTNTLTSLTIDKDEICNRIEGAQGLEKAAIESEFLALEETIEKINAHAKKYLANLFTLPIVARLRVKRTTKKGDASIRPSIDIYVEYKGYVYDDIDDFSGSERQRCDLAFLLGVNDMLGSNIIMLDECFNHMDDKMTVEILQYIKDIMEKMWIGKKQKQLLIVAHNVEDGDFDDIVEVLEENECQIRTALAHAFTF